MIRSPSLSPKSRSPRWRWVLLLGVLGGLCWPWLDYAPLGYAPMAQAQSLDSRTLDARLQRLESDIQRLSRQIYRGNPPVATAPTNSGGSAPVAAGPVAARMDVRITALENQIRTLTGNVEKVSYDVGQLNQRLDRIISDMQLRISALEQGRVVSAPQQPVPAQTPGAVQSGGAVPLPGTSQPGTLGTISPTELPTTTTQQTTPTTPTTPTTTAVDTTSSGLPDGTPEEQYSFARKLLIRSKYGEAESALKSFIATHPSHSLTSNARYWLGETYYVQSKFQMAAATFLDGYQTSPKSDKAPDMLLKLGMSLGQLDKKPEACVTFDKLLSEYSANTSLSNLATRQKQSLSCP